MVYPSAGSHASYYGSAVYLGRGGSEGFGCDTTDGPSERVVPEVILLPDVVEDPADPLAWLSFNGRWGERQRDGSFNGPTGPATKARVDRAGRLARRICATVRSSSPPVIRRRRR